MKRGHDDLRDSDAALANSTWGGVAIEPALVPEDDRHGRPALCADWMARGAWESGRAAFFDNGISDADTHSYVQANLSCKATACLATSAKKKKYRLAAEEVRGLFTPLVCSTDGALHREYAAYLKRLAFCLSSKWEKPYAQVMGWVRIRTQFAILRAVDLRSRGTRRSIHGVFLSDGAAVGVGY